ncbi:Smr/MutS family protein [Roseivivax sp. THAF30]|uniref:Smr/MutS family protein n=1 Tax=Roseivivax sp. THAF30 TaxID=2587852 RepID=UPI00352B848B
MDSKAFTRMKRGKLKPDARLDLHGMTLDRAHPALTRFIFASQARGHRLVLVITGKGQREDPYDPAPRRRGVLKTQVPQWLRMPPLATAVLQISEAHIRHGGGGAYYVYLRRLR